MKKITPFISQHEALTVLDNGGRFYNLITKANDGEINSAELSKVAGVISDKQQMSLFLELSLSKLSSNSKRDIYNSLSDELKKAQTEYAAQYLLPSEAKEKGILSQNAIISGIPKYVESNSNFSGFVMIPIMTGNVMTFTMIPIIDRYDVYEVRDRISSEAFLIAHTKSDDKLPERMITFGGILKELKNKKDESAPSSIFLEAYYYLQS